MNKRKTTTNTNTISYAGRNPHADAAAAKLEAEKAVIILNNVFDDVEKVGRKQLYKINDSFYVYIVSAPTNLKLEVIIRGLFREYGKLPYYVLFTRETDTYPEDSSDSYYSKIRSIDKTKRGYMGCILGLKELKQDSIIESMDEVKKIAINLARYKQTGGNFSFETMLKENGNSAAKIKRMKEDMKLMKMEDLMKFLQS
jgi:hypothetical protein